MPSTLIVGDVIQINDLSSYNFAKGGAAKDKIFGSRGVFAGGRTPPPADVDTIDYITIDVLGNATDFGNLSAVRRVLAATSGD